MFPKQIPEIDPNDVLRCEERGQITEPGKSLSPIQKTDATLKDDISRALWKDDILRAMDYYEVDVRVKNGIVHLNGHIVGTSSQSRIEDALHAVPGILGIKNNLVLDDNLTTEVAASLGKLEHTHGCKFFTVVAHGVVSLSGVVRDDSVKLLAEQCAADNPNVRGVINNLQIAGTGLGSQDQPFLQPAIGETIYFLDGVSGVVKQVIINPDNRRVVAMTLWGRFADQLQELKSLNRAEGRPLERLIVLSLNLVRYLTKVSGFLNTSSYEKRNYMDFDSSAYSTPDVDWLPPYPYCSEDVLVPIEHQRLKNPVSKQLPQPAMVVGLKAQLLGQQLAANDSLGG